MYLDVAGHLGISPVCVWQREGGRSVRVLSYFTFSFSASFLRIDVRGWLALAVVSHCSSDPTLSNAASHRSGWSTCLAVLCAQTCRLPLVCNDCQKLFFYLHISSKYEMFCGPSCVTPKQYCNRFAYLVAVHSARMSAAKEFDLKKSNHSHLLQVFSDGNCFEQVTGQKIDHLCTTAIALYVH